jgi:hypothetical protein
MDDDYLRFNEDKIMSNKSNLKYYGDDELSNWVFNDECMYRMRHNISALRELLDETFLYTDDQWDVLVNDIAEDELEHA